MEVLVRIPVTSGFRSPLPCHVQEAMKVEWANPEERANQSAEAIYLSPRRGIWYFSRLARKEMVLCTLFMRMQAPTGHL